MFRDHVIVDQCSDISWHLKLKKMRSYLKWFIIVCVLIGNKRRRSKADFFLCILCWTEWHTCCRESHITDCPLWPQHRSRTQTLITCLDMTQGLDLNKLALTHIPFGLLNRVLTQLFGVRWGGKAVFFTGLHLNEWRHYGDVTATDPYCCI